MLQTKLVNSTARFSNCKKVKCVDSIIALHLLNVRPTSGTKPVCVTVYSQVMAVSEIIQIKDTQLFLVKLLPNLNIICKRKELLYLHSSISPQKFYIFTNLRHTTLQKGSTFFKPLYTFTKETQILADKSVDVILLTDREWFKEQGLEFRAVDTEVIKEDGMFSYTGTITNVLDARLRVYELDRDVRLYIGQVPAVHKYKDLQVGSTVTVHGVHRHTSEQDSKLTMYGCLLTSLSIVGKADLKTENDKPQIQTVQGPQILKNYLYLYQLSQQKIEHLYHICKTVEEKFCQFGRSVCDRLISTILSTKVLSWEQVTDGTYRNYLDEFLHSPHNCSLTHEIQEIFPKFVSIKNIFENAALAEEGEQVWSYNHKSCMSEQVLTGELDICDKTGQSILRDNTGHISTVIASYITDVKADVQSNNHRGEICHKCNSNCDCSRIDPGHALPCPFFHTCCVGKIVALTKYGIVCENMASYNNQPLVDCQTADMKTYIVFSLRDAIYLGTKKCFASEKKTGRDGGELQTEVKEIIGDNGCNTVGYNLENRTLQQQQITLRKDSQRDSQRDCEIGAKNQMLTSIKSKSPTLHRHCLENGGTYFCRRKECCKTINDTESHKDCTLAKTAASGQKEECTEETSKDYGTGDIKNKCNDEPTYMSGKASTKPYNLALDENTNTSNDDVVDIPLKKRRTRKRKPIQAVETCNKETNFDFSDASWEDAVETATVVIYRKDALVVEECNRNQSRRFCVQGQITKDDCITQATLMFKGKASKWYSVIHQGSTYKFSITAELSPLFKANAGNAQVTQKLRKLNGPVFMVVHELTEIEELFPRNTPERDNDNTDNSVLMPPPDSPASVFAGVFKDIQGVVLSRTFVKNDDTAVQPGRTTKVCTRLKVRCEDGDTVQIYLKLEDFASPLGLVPGSVVYFTRLERRISHLGNVYLRFIPLSSVTVLALRHTTTSGLDQNGPSVDGQIISTSYLRELWEHKAPEGSVVFISMCSVQQILKISQKYVCDYCGSMVTKSKCSNTGCFNTEMGRFLARASILIDDGTSVAMVTLYGDMIKDLLLLTEEQWEAIQMKASELGEIFVQQARPELKNDMEQFLYLLCDNRLVKQVWSMKLKLKQVSKYTDLDNMKSDEFGQKTFDTGTSKVTTRCLPFLQLECLQLQSVDPYQLCLNLMTS